MNSFKVLIVTLLAAISCQAQDWSLVLTSHIEKNEKGFGGATVSLVNGSGAVLQQTTSDGSGFFKLEVPANGDFNVVVARDGHITKKIRVSTTGVPADRNKDNFKVGINIESVSLSEPMPGVDYSGLNEPVLHIKYQADTKEFSDDVAYTDKMQQVLQKIRDREKQLTDAYEASVTAGDAAFKKKNWAGAKEAYEKALAVFAGKEYPKEQLVKVEQLRKAEEEAKKAAAEKAEAERIAKEKAAAEKAEAERIAKEKAEAERIAKEKAAAEKAEAERIAMEKAAAAKAEAERIAKEKAETERIAKEKALAEKQEAERLEKEKREAERVAKEKAAAEKAEMERVAKEKAAAEKAEAERAEKEKKEAERIAKEKAAADKSESERVAAEKAAAERSEAERMAKEKAETEKADQERVAREKAIGKKAEAERIAKEKSEADRLAKEKIMAEKAEAERVAKEKAAAEKAEAERAAKEKAEAVRLAKEKADAEKAEADRLAKAKAAEEKAGDDRHIREKAEADRMASKKTVADDQPADKKMSGESTPASFTPLTAGNTMPLERGTARYTIPQQLGIDKYKSALNKAEGYFKMKRYTEARVAYEDVLKIRPQDAYSKGKLAQIDNYIKK